MRTRLSSRLLVVDPLGQVLLFRFTHTKGALAGKECWATPGGAVEPGESFEAAALRELQEETGIARSEAGAQVARRQFVLQLPQGEHVMADERYFAIRTADRTVRVDGWSPLEMELMTGYRWWSVAELESTVETVWPKDLTSLLLELTDTTKV